MAKVVLKVEISDSKTKKKVLSAVSGLSGIVSMATDAKENKITVIGTADPIEIVKKVRKIWPSAYIISVGPEKEEPKKVEPKKQDPPTPKIEPIDWAKAYTALQSYPTPHYYYSCQEQYNPNACVIS
ncbi:heavy metal-associated isoprenylated plant protein 39-like [Cucurbita moschata]|uniref:Heavy metal-associated isoprenylated plant protein 39-like n=1 Tax=Cucurbita moschata TaxID=3662 RepID=A0A6J1E2W0_CUCMO|nr:heavy metal-associated isoprenylated plant protein 39-like [Cucurbita moschata]